MMNEEQIRETRRHGDAALPLRPFAGSPRQSYPHTAVVVGDRGFTLIEVMIAMLVLTIGLLAIAGMQGMSFSRNMDASEISVATNLGADILERIRFNRPNVTAYNNIDTLVPGTQPPATQPMARGDYAEWAARLGASGLASVRGQVTVVTTVFPAPLTTSQSQVTVLLTWSGRARGEAVVLRTRSLTLTTVVTPE